MIVASNPANCTAMSLPSGTLDIMTLGYGVSDIVQHPQSTISAKATNIVMLGALCKLFDFDKAIMQQAVKECVPAKFQELNLKAFEIGFERV